MLIEFNFKNYRSFRDKAVLSMEATGLGRFKNSLKVKKVNGLLHNNFWLTYFLYEGNIILKTGNMSVCQVLR